MKYHQSEEWKKNQKIPFAPTNPKLKTSPKTPFCAIKANGEETKHRTANAAWYEILVYNRKNAHQYDNSDAPIKSGLAQIIRGAHDPSTGTWEEDTTYYKYI